MASERHGLIVSLCCVLALAGAVPAHAFDESQLTGYWYGEGQPGDEHIAWLAHRGADGRFSVEFRRYTECHGVTIETQEGTWSLAGDLYESRIATRDGTPVPAGDSGDHFDYTVLSVSPNVLLYRHTGSGFVFTAKRVDKDFRFPDCFTGV